MAFLEKSKYAALRSPDSDAEQGGPVIVSSRPSRFGSLLQAATLIVCSALLGVVLFARSSPAAAAKSIEVYPAQDSLPLGMSRINPTTAHRLAPCGDNAATARARGCIFDPLLMGWVTTDCYDPDLTKEFLKVAYEPFYLDPNDLSTQIDYDQLSERPQGTYSWTTRKYHIFHCAYSWRVFHQVLDRGGMLPSGLSSPFHTQHCSQQLMNQSVPLDKVITRVEISFPDC